MTIELSKFCSPIVYSITVGDDIVGRLSLSSFRDLKRVVWTGGLAHQSDIQQRIQGDVENPELDQDEKFWLWGLRKTLRADMQEVKPYLPGRFVK